MAGEIDADARAPRQSTRPAGASPPRAGCRRSCAPSTSTSFGHLQREPRRPRAAAPTAPRPAATRGDEAELRRLGRRRCRAAAAARDRDCPAARPRPGRAGRARRSARAPRRACPPRAPVARQALRLVVGAADRSTGDRAEERGGSAGRQPVIPANSDAAAACGAVDDRPGQQKKNSVDHGGDRAGSPFSSTPIGRSNALRRLVEIHDLDDAQVVEGADTTLATHADHGEPDRARHRSRRGRRRACRRSRRAAGCPAIENMKIAERQRQHRLGARQAGEIG